MRRGPFRNLSKAMRLLFCLMAIIGWFNVPPGEAAVGESPAVLQTITVADDGASAVIVADRPLTFTFYKVADPPMAVIDLAQTEPGSVAPAREMSAGSVKGVAVTRHAFGGGVLSRVEITLARNTEFTVTADPVNRNILKIEFGKAETLPAAKTVEPAAPAPVAQEAPAAVTAAPVAAEAQTEPAAVPGDKGPRTVTAVRKTDDGFAIEVKGGVESFNSFRMTKPDRIVVDIPAAKNGIMARSVELNSFGVGKARVGTTPDKVRIVFDAAKNVIPPSQVSKDEAGVRILIGERAATAPPVAAEPRQAPKEVAAEPVPDKPAAPKAAKAGKPTVENIDFSLVNGASQIAIRLSGDCAYDAPVRSPQGLTLTLKNCQIPASLQRTFDTSSFASVVTQVVPLQVKTKKGPTTKIVAKLRAEAPFELKREGDTILWTITNTVVPPPQDFMAPKLASDKASTAPEAAAAPEQRTTIIAPKVSDRKQYTGRRISLEFSDADIRKIFQLIAEVSNLNFLLGDDVTGTISLKLINVPWDQALDVILDSRGLEKRQQGNIVLIKPLGKFKSLDSEEVELRREIERKMRLSTRIFDINYSNVSEVASQLATLKTMREGVSVTPDLRTNRVIVTDIQPAIDKMEELIKSLDIPERQVMIEARIVEASTDFTRDIGVQWNIRYRDGDATISSLDTSFGGIVSTVLPTATTGGGAMGISFGKLTSNLQVNLRISAAASIGQAKIISTPKVMTVNNKPAKISQGQSIPYSTVSAEGTKTEFVEAALTLEVTPHITADGSIGMKIKASNNSAGVGSPPPINKKEATTELVVKNGETTVIGGIYVDNETESDSGVPFLKDIPLLGWLFKSQSKRNNKTELLIFITPKIVS